MVEAEEARVIAAGAQESMLREQLDDMVRRRAEQGLNWGYVYPGTAADAVVDSLRAAGYAVDIEIDEEGRERWLVAW